MQSSPVEEQMSSANANRPDVIGKVFFAVGRDVRQCLVCGELFTRSAAAKHAEVDCNPFLELSVVYPSTGGKDVT
jgi:hypothetical protein